MKTRHSTIKNNMTEEDIMGVTAPKKMMTPALVGRKKEQAWDQESKIDQRGNQNHKERPRNCPGNLRKEDGPGSMSSTLD